MTSSTDRPELRRLVKTPGQSPGLAALRLSGVYVLAMAGTGPVGAAQVILGILVCDCWALAVLLSGAQR